MKRIIGIVTIAVVLFLLSLSCTLSRYMSEGDYFFLENDGAVMPIWVNGNIASGVFIITVHGGPGATSGHEFPLSFGFQYLEEDYAVVYWDQRMSGMAQGDPAPETLTIDQHIEDLDMVVQIIKEKYSNPVLFLLGHSWGGVMTGGYLGRGTNQDQFNGWIDVDGSIQEAFEAQQMKTWILDRVPAGMAQSEDPEFWQYIIDWYADNPNPVQSDEEPYWYAGALNGYAYDWEKTQAENPTPYLELAFSSPFTFAFYWSQYADTTWVDGYDVTAEVGLITIPSLLLWGKEDGVVTAEVGQFTYDTLGTVPAQKQLVLIEQSAHSPYFDTPAEFYNNVKAFVDLYK
jgi:pimeloyl-ACP methyl ester carboxylesterase